MLLADKILAAIKEHPGIDDAGIVRLLPGGPSRHQQVNSRCRQLAKNGLIVRDKRDGQRIGNFPVLPSGVSSTEPDVRPFHDTSIKRGSNTQPPSPARERALLVSAVPAISLGVSFTWQSAGEIALDVDGKLDFPTVAVVPGIYRIRLASTKSVYVGEAVNLKRRMQNYRNPGGNQKTSIWINALLCERLRGGELVMLEVSVDATVNDAGRPLDANLTSKTVRLFAECAAILSETGNDWNIMNKAN